MQRQDSSWNFRHLRDVRDSTGMSRDVKLGLPPRSAVRLSLRFHRSNNTFTCLYPSRCHSLLELGDKSERFSIFLLSLYSRLTKLYNLASACGCHGSRLGLEFALCSLSCTISLLRAPHTGQLVQLVAAREEEDDREIFRMRTRTIPECSRHDSYKACLANFSISPRRCRLRP